MKPNKFIVEENEQPKSFVWLRLLSLLSIVVAILYLIYPGDYDNGIIGRIDDFLFFMSAFCFAYSQFIDNMHARASIILAVVSILFCLLGAIWLLLLIFLF